MPLRARIPIVLLAFLAAFLVAAVPIAASPEDVAADYYADGVIDDRHSTRDLLAALDAALDREEPQYGAFADAVGVALDERLLGVESNGTRQFLGGVGEAAQVPPLSPFPSPPPPVPGGCPPWALVALAFMGGGLLVAGASSAVYRRVREHGGA